jgi:ribose 5-phosphate isomerase B
MKIALGSDEKTALTDSLIEKLTSSGHDLTLFGPLKGAKAYWPSVAREVAEAVARGQIDEGILLCWTGTGVSLAANKVPGIRAALCVDAQTARGARLWNDANVLCLSLRLTSQAIAGEIIEAWFETSYIPNPEDDTCLALIRELELEYSHTP